MTAKVSHEMLCMSVPTEHLFSKKRNSLAVGKAEKLIVLMENIQHVVFVLFASFLTYIVLSFLLQ